MDMWFRCRQRGHRKTSCVTGGDNGKNFICKKCLRGMTRSRVVNASSLSFLERKSGEAAVPYGGNQE